MRQRRRSTFRRMSRLSAQRDRALQNEYWKRTRNLGAAVASVPPPTPESLGRQESIDENSSLRPSDRLEACTPPRVGRATERRRRAPEHQEHRAPRRDFPAHGGAQKHWSRRLRNRPLARAFS